MEAQLPALHGEGCSAGTVWTEQVLPSLLASSGNVYAPVGERPPWGRGPGLRSSAGSGNPGLPGRYFCCPSGHWTCTLPAFLGHAPHQGSPRLSVPSHRPAFGDNTASEQQMMKTGSEMGVPVGCPLLTPLRRRPQPDPETAGTWPCSVHPASARLKTKGRCQRREEGLSFRDAFAGSCKAHGPP